MTVESSARSAISACNGVTQDFAVPFEFADNGSLGVYLLDSNVIDVAGKAPLTEGLDYTIAGDGRSGGASVHTATAYPAGKYLLRWRATPLTQETDYVPFDGFPAQAHERALDRLTMIDQEHADDLADVGGRAIVAPRGEVGLTLAPAAESRVANRVFGRDPVTGAPAEIDLPKSFKGDPGGNVMAIGLFSSASQMAVAAGTDLVRTSGHSSEALGFGDYAAFDLGSQAANDVFVAANPLAAFKSANDRYFRLASVEPSAEMFGAVGDGATDDRDALNAALAQGVGGKLTMPRAYTVSAGAANPNQALPDPDPSALTITKSDFVLDGLGMGAAACTGANKSIFHLKNASEANRPRRVVIRNFRKLVQAYGNPEFGGLNDDYFTIRAEAAEDCLFENLHIEQCELGFTDQFGETYNYCKYLTFDAETDVSTADNTITVNKGLDGSALAHDFVTGSKVAMSMSGTTVWAAGPGVVPTGLTAPYRYYVIVVDAATIKLAASLDDAFASPPVAVDLTAVGSGTITIMRMERVSKRNTLKNFSIEKCAYMGIQLGSCQEGFYEGRIIGQDSDGHSRGVTHALRSDGFWFGPTSKIRHTSSPRGWATG